MSDQVDTIPGLEFVDNANQRTPCVLVLDCSGSMAGPSISELNVGLQQLETSLKDDKTARTRVQLLIIEAAGEVKVVSDWCDAIDFSAPVMEVSGATPLGEAMDLALQSIEQQKGVYKQNGIAYTRPWIIVISDGAPTDDWQPVAERCRSAEASKKVEIFPVGVNNADLSILSSFAHKGALKLNGLAFKELFVWLSQSTSRASQSKASEQIQLPAVSGWATTTV